MPISSSLNNAIKLFEFVVIRDNCGDSFSISNNNHDVNIHWRDLSEEPYRKPTQAEELNGDDLLIDVISGHFDEYTTD